MTTEKTGPEPVRSGLAAGRLLMTLALALTALTALMAFAAPAVANNGAIQIGGEALLEPHQTEPCYQTLPPGADYAFALIGDLEGCLYVFVESAQCSPSGTYRERGTELYDIHGGAFGAGTFMTTYLGTMKWTDCVDGVPMGVEIFGRCQHPLIAGSGTGAFAGATGRLDFKDMVKLVPPRFPFRGHLQWRN